MLPVEANGVGRVVGALSCETGFASSLPTRSSFMMIFTSLTNSFYISEQKSIS